MEVRGQIKCWEFFSCDEQECPVHKSKEKRCWLVSGTHCRDEIQGRFLEKVEMCLKCEVFKANIDVDSMEETLTVVNRQFIEFRGMVEERDRELEETSMELAIGLSEVFEALRQISLGDPEIRIPETSELELITKLKQMVNLTAINLAGIVNLSHEFAIGLAEHFDVLHRVSQGELDSRVSGTSQVELLEFLKKVTNQMIESVSQEITHRKLTEVALRESEERYRAVLKASPDAIVVYDTVGNCTYVNPAFTTIFGWTTEELIGKQLDHVPQENWSETQLIIDSVQAGKSFSGVESRRYTKDGNTLDVSISAGIHVGRDGTPVGSVHILRDITRRKQAEEKLKELMAELQRSNAELEQFAYVASHDMQEPLRKILSFGDRLEARYAKALDERGRDYMARMQNAAKRMQSLINNLLTLSRITIKAQPFVRINLADVVQTVMSDLELHVERAGGRVETGDMPTIDADPTQMRQLLQNLINNGLKFHEPEKKPVVKIHSQLMNETCTITVEDNGIGFDEKYLDRIFGVFQRLHGRGQYDGTGVGLAICQKIAERHGGSITARSSPGQGATFIVTLPVRHTQETEK
ncbi:MAG: PAS domain S-box protein [Deltaproteobacteria bacterium]|nr:PAS domain S-box protein [Deltaproteobacteria bacterium]